MDSSTWYLRVAASDGASVSRLGDYTQELASGLKIPLVFAINPFVAIDRVVASCADSIERLPRGDAVTPTRPHGLAALFAEWKAEALAIVFAERPFVQTVLAADLHTSAPWWHLTASSWEANYLRLLPRCDPIVFFAESHKSIELFGTAPTVWAALLAARQRLL
jgi:hypothetical protein